MTIKNQRKIRTSNKIKSGSNRPRLIIFRSNKDIYASIVDANGKILASASSLKNPEKNRITAAQKVGADIAAKAKSNKISEIVFDRRGYMYHGRVAALAKAARDQGLKF